VRRRFRVFFEASLLSYLLASATLHLLILALIQFNPFQSTLKNRWGFEPQIKPAIEVSLTTDESIEKNDRTLGELPKSQIVDQSEQALNDEIPEQTRFLSRNNQVVQKQTIAENRGLFQNRSKRLKFNPGFDIVKSVSKRESLETKVQNAIDQNEALPEEVNKEFGDRKPAQRLEPKRPSSAVDKGSNEQEGDSDQASQSLDYIPELEVGVETLLTTKEFVFYTYYNRIRTQLHPHWTGFVRSQLSKAQERGRSIASISGPQVTRTLVTLSPTGQLLRVQIIGKSTVPELDEAAVLAFRRAAPFPNPPEGMRDPDGNIKIRWDFIVQ
jgi:protein TonB